MEIDRARKVIPDVMEWIALDRPNWRAEEGTVVVWIQVLRGLPEEDLRAAVEKFLRSDNPWPSAGTLLRLAIRAGAERKWGRAPGEEQAVQLAIMCARDGEAVGAKGHPWFVNAYMLSKIRNYPWAKDEFERNGLVKAFRALYREEQEDWEQEELAQLPPPGGAPLLT